MRSLGSLEEYFDFIEKTSPDELPKIKAGFYSLQVENLELMKALVEKNSRRMQAAVVLHHDNEQAQKASAVSV